MRRLAKQSREDTYSSNRDYQAIHDRRAQRFDADAHGRVCWGGYILSTVPTTVTATLTVGDADHVEKIRVEPNWRRFGDPVSGGARSSADVRRRRARPAG